MQRFLGDGIRLSESSREDSFGLSYWASDKLHRVASDWWWGVMGLDHRVGHFRPLWNLAEVMRPRSWDRPLSAT